MPNNDQNQAPDQQLQATAQQPATPPAAQPPATPAQGTTAAPTAQPTAPNPYASARPMSVPASQNPVPQTMDPNSHHINVFSRILGMVNPGTSYTSADGSQVVDRSAPTLGKLITASVLSGMFAKNET